MKRELSKAEAWAMRLHRNDAREAAKRIRFATGKYAGLFMGEVAELDPSYLLGYRDGAGHDSKGGQRITDLLNDD